MSLTRIDRELIVEKMKRCLRMSGEDLDREIMDEIDNCESELERVGISVNETRPLTLKAIELYLKWQWDYLGKGEHFEKNFCSLRDAMSLCEYYTSEGGDCCGT